MNPPFEITFVFDNKNDYNNRNNFNTKGYKDFFITIWQSFNNTTTAIVRGSWLKKEDGTPNDGNTVDYWDRIPFKKVPFVLLTMTPSHISNNGQEPTLLSIVENPNTENLENLAVWINNNKDTIIEEGDLKELKEATKSGNSWSLDIFNLFIYRAFGNIFSLVERIVK
mgnify:CR=1 FL=1